MGDFVTQSELMKDMGIKDHRKILKLIADGDFPPYSFGSHVDKVKGWHRAVLRTHSLSRYRRQQAIRDAV